MNVSISWEFDKKPEIPTVPGRAWGGASVYNDIDCIGGGSFNCQLSYVGVYFEGNISFTPRNNITYKYYLKNGVYNMTTNYGSYTIGEIKPVGGFIKYNKGDMQTFSYDLVNEKRLAELI